MKVVFLEDVEGVALGGDVKNVKNGSPETISSRNSWPFWPPRTRSSGSTG